MEDKTYYNEIARGYDELHESEQQKKIGIIMENIEIDKNDTVLDVGCGTGLFLERIERKCMEAIGVYPSEELLKVSEKRFSGQLLHGFAEDPPFKDKEFDVVVSITAIQNFNNIEEGLEEIKRVGKERFALTVLKKSEKAGMAKELINNIFNNKNRTNPLPEGRSINRAVFGMGNFAMNGGVLNPRKISSKISHNLNINIIEEDKDLIFIVR